MYAIDFGTSNTVVSRWNPVTQQAETLALGPLSFRELPHPPLVPSLVYIKGAEDILCGQAVRDQGLDLAGDPRFFRGFKRGIGSAIQGFMPQVEGVDLSFEQVGHYFLGRVFQQLQIQGERVDDLVITVPVNSFEAYRQWLQTEVSHWGINRVQLVDEPTAAALGYQTEGLVLVFDFGGGTLDLALIEPPPKERVGLLIKWGQVLNPQKQRPRAARVIAKVGRTLGGSDIDSWLAQVLAQNLGILRSYRLQQVAERIKIRLATQDAYSEPYLDEETFSTYEVGCTRSQLEELLKVQGFFKQLDQALAELTQQARNQGINLQEVPQVLVVGGTSLLPAVQQWLKAQFSQQRLYLDKPFECVAHGALVLGRGLEIKDYLYHAYGVRYWDHRHSRHGWQPLFQKGTPYPSTPYELILGCSVSGQPNIELVIGELADQGTATEIYFDGTSLVTRQGTKNEATVRPLNDTDQGRTIAALDPPGYPGTDRIRVTFQVDQARTLRMSVKDLLTGQILAQDQAVIELR